jgi:hypothetical protein
MPKVFKNLYDNYNILAQFKKQHERCTNFYKDSINFRDFRLIKIGRTLEKCF